VKVLLRNGREAEVISWGRAISVLDADGDVVLDGEDGRVYDKLTMRDLTNGHTREIQNRINRGEIEIPKIRRFL